MQKKLDNLQKVEYNRLKSTKCRKVKTMSVNDCLKNYVDMIGIKQSYLSEKTKIPADTISKILNGKRKMTAEELLLVCDALHIDPRALWHQSA